MRGTLRMGCARVGRLNTPGFDASSRATRRDSPMWRLLASFSIFLIAGSLSSPAWAQRHKEETWACTDNARQTVTLTSVPPNTLAALVITACDMRYELLPREGADITARAIDKVQSFQRDTVQPVIMTNHP